MPKGVYERKPKGRICSKDGCGKKHFGRGWCQHHYSRYWKTYKKYGQKGLDVLARIDAGEPCEVCHGYTAKMAIDHDHSNGEARGLLCGNCNSALGLLKEDVTAMVGLLDYLLKDRHEEEQFVLRDSPEIAFTENEKYLLRDVL